MVKNILLPLAALLSGLISGLFYAYSCSVIPGLGRLADAEYMAAMQSINRAILNPVFFASFMGTLLILPAATWVGYTQWSPFSFYCLLAASIIYFIGVFGITAACNVPLNEALDRFDLSSADASAISAKRAAFESTWNAWHQVRTFFSVVSFTLVILAILKK